MTSAVFFFLNSVTTATYWVGFTSDITHCKTCRYPADEHISKHLVYSTAVLCLVCISSKFLCTAFITAIGMCLRDDF